MHAHRKLGELEDDHRQHVVERLVPPRGPPAGPEEEEGAEAEARALALARYLVLDLEELLGVRRLEDGRRDEQQREAHQLAEGEARPHQRTELGVRLVRAGEDKRRAGGGEDVEGEGEVGRLARGAGGVDAGGDDDGEQQRLAEDGDERRRGGVQVRELLGMMTSTGAVVSRG